MNIIDFIANHTIEDIIMIESKDPQFLALKNLRYNINRDYGNLDVHKNIFFFLIIQNALISYQLSGTGYDRRDEFANKIHEDFTNIKKTLVNNKSNINRREDFIKNSKHNKRLYNMKIKRLKKFENFNKGNTINTINTINNHDYNNYYDNMEILLSKISLSLKQNLTKKTIVFAIKMFGYGARVVFNKINIYPHNIQIPVDSRLKKIFYINNGNTIIQKDIYIQGWFNKIAQDNNIAPLHLDSLLWLKYWEIFVKKTNAKY